MLTTANGYLFENDKPFFWLGDTAWLLAENIDNFEEVELYLKNRSSLGFNVIQLVLFYTLPPDMKIEGGMLTPRKNIFCAEYVDYVNKIIARAQDYGIYTALLPCWGSYVQNRIVTLDNADKFTDFLVDTFSGNDKLIWVLGGDAKTDGYVDVYDCLGTLLKKKDDKHLITFHPFGRTLSARWFNDCKWLDFNMFQSGHRRYDQVQMNLFDDVTERVYGEDNWRYVVENNNYSPVKPCFDAEPSYEGILQGLHNANEPYWEAPDVRRYAYWSVFEGACGFTYGNNAIIQFYDDRLKNGAYGVRESWQTALHAEGGLSMQFIKGLMTSVNFTSGKPHTDYLISPQRERYHRVSIFAGDDFLFAYCFTGDEFTLSLERYSHLKMDAFWMNPQNGAQSYLGAFVNQKEAKLAPTRRMTGSNDWVLILKKSL